MTASAGVAPNKFLAKIASDLNKPNGLSVIPPERVETFLEDLPVRKIPGVGKVTEQKMAAMRILTTKQLRAKSEQELLQAFGKTGSWFYRIARGEDNRPVVPERNRKSVGTEDTFETDLLELGPICEEVVKLSQKTQTRLKKS